MTAESSISRPQRPDGLNLASPEAPGKLFGLLRDNFNNGEVKNPKTFIDDALDLRSTGALDEVDVFKEKMIWYGQNPVLQTEIYIRAGRARAGRNTDEANQIIELGKLWGIDLPTRGSRRVEDNKTTKERAEKIAKAVSSAEFDSSKEFIFLKGSETTNPETDLIVPLAQENDRAKSLFFGAADANGLIPPLVPGELVCVTGSKEGKFIIQGGGELHSNETGVHISSFKLEFTDSAQLQEFTDWLKARPAEALSSMVQTFLDDDPELQNSNGARALKNIFSKDISISRVLIKELETPAAQPAGTEEAETTGEDEPEQPASGPTVKEFYFDVPKIARTPDQKIIGDRKGKAFGPRHPEVRIREVEFPKLEPETPKEPPAS